MSSDQFERQLTISIADWPVTLLFARADSAIQTSIGERYADFVVAPGRQVISVRTRVEAGELFIPFDGVSAWQVRTCLRQGRVEFESHLEKGWLDLAHRQGELVLRPKGDPENFLRVLYAWLCLQHDSLLLHSCGIIRDGRGYVFFGPSGSGKTTTTRLSAAHTILSDDMVILKKIAGRYHVVGVPFRGDMPETPRTNASAELAGLYSLVKDKEAFLEPLAPAQATARLVQCVPFVMAQPENALRVTLTCADLNAQVPVQSLHFRKDQSFWGIIP